MHVFSGIWIPLVTPFRQGRVDHEALRRLVRHYRAARVSGLVACGSTGEASAMEADEQTAALDTVLDAAAGLPVAMGLAGSHCGQLQRRIAALGRRPLAALLVPAPYYVRPSQEGLLRHFLTLADASPWPLIVYDIPYRTGAVIETVTLERLGAHPGIRAVKDCGGSLDKTVALIGRGFDVLAGEDLHVLSTLCLGGSGAIAASAHLRPDLFVALHEAVARQHLAHARALFQALAPVIRLLFAQPNPGPLKALLARQGLIGPELREPFLPADPALARRLFAAADELDRAFPAG